MITLYQRIEKAEAEVAEARQSLINETLRNGLDLKAPERTRHQTAVKVLTKLNRIADLEAEILTLQIA